MALTFPSSPTNGQLYTDTVTGNRYVYDSAKTIWKFASNNVGVSISSIPPANVSQGAMWFNREIGRTFIYYDDGDSKQWIETVPAGTTDTNLITSYTNPIYASLNIAWTYTNTAYSASNVAYNAANTALQNTSGVSFNGNLTFPTGNVGMSGTLGVGTTTPTGRFQVVGANGEISRLTATGASGGYEVFYFDNSTPWYIGSSKATINGNINDLYFGSGFGTTNNLIFGSSGTEKVRLDYTGNVGIGTASPTVSLDIGSKTDGIKLPVGSLIQRPTAATGMLRFNNTYSNLEMYNGSYWFNIGASSTSPTAYDGSTAAQAALSAWDIKMLTGTNTDGVYYINLPTVGATQVYCLMDTKWAGGGWMMAMKATRGTTFPYASTYWTAINTLNPVSGLSRADGDAKFDSFNYYQGKDLLALWPDIGQGGMLQSTGCWSWVENNFLMGAKTTLQNFFNTNHQINKGSGKSFGGWGFGTFSSQSGFQWYGFNYQSSSSNQGVGALYKVRWGFAWNNENDQSSNDVSGGIGMSAGSYSAGDYISSAQDTTGINRTARVELYIR